MTSLTLAESAATGGISSRRSRNGFTLIELILVIVIVSVVGVTAVDRFLFYQERAEKAAMDAVLASVKMGLQIRMAELIMTNRQNLAGGIERENPIRWLDEPPGNYAGPYRAPAERGNWYFAQDSRQLIYAPSNNAYLTGQQQGERPELRFKIVLRYTESEIQGSQARTLAGVSIVPVSPYRWF